MDSKELQPVKTSKLVYFLSIIFILFLLSFGVLFGYGYYSYQKNIDEIKHTRFVEPVSETSSTGNGSGITVTVGDGNGFKEPVDPLTTKPKAFTGTVGIFYETKDGSWTFEENLESSYSAYLSAFSGAEDSPEFESYDTAYTGAQDMYFNKYVLGGVSFKVLEGTGLPTEYYNTDTSEVTLVWTGNILSGSHVSSYENDSIKNIFDRKGMAYSDGIFNRDEYLGFIKKLAEPYKNYEAIETASGTEDRDFGYALLSSLEYLPLVDSKHFSEIFVTAEPVLIKLSKSSKFSDILVANIQLKKLYENTAIKLSVGDISKDDASKILDAIMVSEYDGVDNFKKFLIANMGIYENMHGDIDTSGMKKLLVSPVLMSKWAITEAYGSTTGVKNTPMELRVKSFLDAYVAENFTKEKLEYYNAFNKEMLSGLAIYSEKFFGLEKLRNDLIRGLVKNNSVKSEK